MVKSKNPVWDYYDGNTTEATCKKCTQIYKGGKVGRMENHIPVSFIIKSNILNLFRIVQE